MQNQYWRLVELRRERLLYYLAIAAVCGGILFASGYLIPHASQLQIEIMLAAFLVLFAALLLISRPSTGIALLIPVCLIVPFEIGTGTNTSVHAGILLVVFLLGLWALDTVVRRDTTFLLPRSGPVLALTSLVLATSLAFAGGQLSWFVAPHAPMRAQIGGLLVFVLSVGAFMLVAFRVRELKWLQWMTLLYLAFGALYIAGRLIPPIGQYIRYIIRPSATGSLFWVWIVVLAAGQMFFNRQLSRAARLGLFVLVAATLYVAVVQGAGWKSGWIPPLVALGVIGILRWPRLIPVAVVVVLIAASRIIPSLIASDAYSYSTRLEAWQILGEMLKRNPVLGFGPANYYWYTPLYAIRGYYVNFNSHSQYFDLLLQVGIVGLLCFIWFAWETGRLGWQLRTQATDGFARGYVYGVLGGLAGTLAAGALGDWVLPFVYNIGLSGMRATIPAWMFLGGLVALERMMAAQTLTHETEASIAVSIA